MFNLLMAPASGWNVHVDPNWILPAVVGFILGAVVFGKMTR